jgi:hypothetical protein
VGKEYPSACVCCSGSPGALVGEDSVSFPNEVSVFFHGFLSDRGSPILSRCTMNETRAALIVHPWSSHHSSKAILKNRGTLNCIVTISESQSATGGTMITPYILVLGADGEPDKDVDGRQLTEAEKAAIAKKDQEMRDKEMGTEFPLDRVAHAYNHSALTPYNSARAEKESFDKHIDRVRQMLKDSPQNLSTSQIEKIVNQEKKDYLRERESVWNARSSTVSSLVAGKSKFNYKQSQRRSNALDRAEDGFYKKLERRISDIDETYGGAKQRREAAAAKAKAKADRASSEASVLENAKSKAGSMSKKPKVQTFKHDIARSTDAQNKQFAGAAAKAVKELGSPAMFSKQADAKAVIQASGNPSAYKVARMGSSTSDIVNWTILPSDFSY